MWVSPKYLDVIMIPYSVIVIGVIMLTASEITSLPIICNKITKIQQQNTITGSGFFLSTGTIMFLSYT